MGGRGSWAHSTIGVGPEGTFASQKMCLDLTRRVFWVWWVGRDGNGRENVSRLDKEGFLDVDTVVVL